MYIGATSMMDASWVGSNFPLPMLKPRYKSSDLVSTRPAYTSGCIAIVPA